VSDRLIARVFERSQASGVDLLVEVALAHFCNHKRGDNIAYPSLAVLAKRVKLTVPGLCKSLTRLEAMSEIRRDRSRGGWNKRTRYIICPGNSKPPETVSSVENSKPQESVSEKLNSKQENSIFKNSISGNSKYTGSETVNDGLQAENKNRTRNRNGHFSAPNSDHQRESATASDDAFERAWRNYPKRAGGNSKKEALKAWTARVRSGVDPAEMGAGVERYARYIRATGKEGTEYVKQGASFFGPGEHWKESWEVPPSNSGRSAGGFAA